MSFKVETVSFEGPLDLILHLISTHELDIFDLDLTVLIDQYVAYLDKLEALHLEIESVYLDELATLIEYKSKMLLPKPSQMEELQEDPRQQLVERLLEYQKYKDVSSVLQENYYKRQEQFSKPLTVFQDEEEEYENPSGNPYDLLKAMRRMLRRASMQKEIPTRYTYRELSTQDRILQIKVKIASYPQFFSLEDICDDCQNVDEYIVSFLAVLDMIKDRFLLFDQKGDQITFTRGSAYESR